MNKIILGLVSIVLASFALYVYVEKKGGNIVAPKVILTPAQEEVKETLPEYDEAIIVKKVIKEDNHTVSNETDSVPEDPMQAFEEKIAEEFAASTKYTGKVYDIDDFLKEADDPVEEDTDMESDETDSVQEDQIQAFEEKTAQEFSNSSEYTGPTYGENDLLGDDEVSTDDSTNPEDEDNEYTEEWKKREISTAPEE